MLLLSWLLKDSSPITEENTGPEFCQPAECKFRPTPYRPAPACKSSESPLIDEAQ